MRNGLFAFLPLVCLLSNPVCAQQRTVSPPLRPCEVEKESCLELPSHYAAAHRNDISQYQRDVLAPFLTSLKYQSLGWHHDKGVRDTGPFINGRSYGTHPVVRIWYSPVVYNWILGGRKGTLPAGAMIIKEQFDTSPAAQYQGWSADQLNKYFYDHYDWTVMIKDPSAVADGWYWAEIWKGMSFDAYGKPFAVFNAGYGLYCLRCHASAESDMTFSSATNIEGQPGTPHYYRVDTSWLSNQVTAPTGPFLPPPAPLPPPTHPHVSAANIPRLAVPHPSISSDWAKFFKNSEITSPPRDLPGETYDHVVSTAGTPRQYVTSDQCFGCHSGNSYGNVMMAPDNRLLSQPLVDVSPYGEWRWSPMGLAGRDPIFYAQLESERAYLSKHQSKEMLENVTDICFSCHGGMGERQLKADNKDTQDQKAKVKSLEQNHSAGLNAPDPHPFDPSIVRITDQSDPKFVYGALARDGISCAMCHHIQSTTNKSVMDFIAEDARGQFQPTPPDQIEGPYENPAVVPMHNALGIKPVHDEYTKNARICGTCHTIPVPVVDYKEPLPAPLPGHTATKSATAADECHDAKTSFEQATYLEWLNSDFQNEIPSEAPSANQQTCQSCHMQSTLNGAPLQTKTAAVQDAQYPESDHTAPLDQLDVRIHSADYARHQLQGLNVFLLAMFDQFNETLGVRKCDYMTSGCSGAEPASAIPFAMRNFLEDMTKKTATISVSNPTIGGETLTADVLVTNLTGHRFPSGVSFRRAFIDFAVSDWATGEVYWESGRTNSIGALVDMNGAVLESEYNGAVPPPPLPQKISNAFQPHFWTGNPIRRSDQVQIYEELLKNADGDFTTSFIRQDCHYKDNRILPRGWKYDGPNLKYFSGAPLEETRSDLTEGDPYYSDPLGKAGASAVRYSITLPKAAQNKKLSVTAQLYYQAIPPYYLLQRFQQAPDGPGTQQLYYFTSTMDASKTAFPNWKLLVTQAESTIQQ